jgi:3-oxoacyl-[acyl-carrier protein] reductase
VSCLSGAIVVTGAARGIGRGIAARLVDAGAHVVLVDRDEQVRRTAAGMPAGRTSSVVCDVGDVRGSAVAIKDRLSELTEPLSGLVNNAGITRDALADRMSDREWTDVLRINLGAAYGLTMELSNLMTRGAVVSLSSRSYLGSVGQLNYAASKGGLVGMTRALALELAPAVRLNAIAPSLVETDMTAAIPEHIRDRLIGSIPFGRMGTPAEIASVVSWLLSQDAEYLTGQCLLVCGGRSLSV